MEPAKVASHVCSFPDDMGAGGGAGRAEPEEKASSSILFTG